MSVSIDAADEADNDRSRAILDAGLRVFVRFGYRKTAMDEVARAAGISRQGLYLHHGSKEDLFRAIVQRMFTDSLTLVTAALADESQSIEDRLVGAFDAWIGRWVDELRGAELADLLEATQRLVGPQVARAEEAFTRTLARALRRSGVASAYKAAGIGARQLAETLHATARGLKYATGSRSDFLARMTIAIRVMCQPLRGDR